MAPIARMPIHPPADLFSSRTPPLATPDPADRTQRPHQAAPGPGPTKPEQKVGPGQEGTEGQRSKAEPRGNYMYTDEKNDETALQPPQPSPWPQHIQFARAEGHAPRPEQTDALARAAREFYTQGLERQRQMRVRRRLVVLLYVVLLAAGVGLAGWWAWGKVCGSERGL